MIEPAEVAADDPVAVTAAVASDPAELATEAEADDASVAAPPESGAGAPPSAPCWPCLLTGDHAQVVDESASAYIDNVDKDSMLSINVYTCSGLRHRKSAEYKSK